MTVGVGSREGEGRCVVYWADTCVCAHCVMARAAAGAAAATAAAASAVAAVVRLRRGSCRCVVSGGR